MLNATTDSIPNDLSVLKYIPDILSHKIILLLLENSVYFTSRWIIFYLSLIIFHYSDFKKLTMSEVDNLFYHVK